MDPEMEQSVEAPKNILSAKCELRILSPEGGI